MAILTTIIVLFLLGLIARTIIGIKQNKQWAKIIGAIIALILTIFAMLILLSSFFNMS